MASQKYNFLYALIITVIVFNIGIFMGYSLESSRINKISGWTFEAEMSLLDQRVQERAFETINLSCEDLTEENIAFADRIYEEALKITKYEEANRINDDIIQLHQRFDLLRTLLWMNSIKIKEKCSSDYHNLIYFYKYNDPSLEQKAKQRFFSNLLMELKEEYGNNIILIPIAGDNDLPSVNLLLNKYNVTELPVILIDEEFKVSDVNSKEDVEKYLG